MANRVITATVQGEYIKLSSRIAGAAGSHNAVTLGISFDSEWDGTSRKVYFISADGAKNACITLTTNLLVSGETDKYNVEIPSEGLASAGEMTLTVKGYHVADGATVADRVIMSASTRMTVLRSDKPDADNEPADVTTAQAEQLQGEIDDIKSQIGGAAEAATAAKASADAAAQSATAATNSATAASNSAAAASTSAQAAATAKAAAESAQSAAETAKAAALAAQSAAETAKTAAETAQGKAETAETNAVTAKTAAESAQSLAETAKTAAQTAQEAAEAAQEDAEVSASNAATSETNAKTSETNAKNSETNAKTSENNAKVSETNAANSASTASSCASQVADAMPIIVAKSASGVFVGTGEMPEGYNFQIDPTGDALTVVNDLTTGGTEDALSAEQGKVLSASISELSADTKFPVTNANSNGNFVDTSGWSATAATNTVASNELSNTGSGSSAILTLYQNTSVSASNGKKVYVRAILSAASGLCTRIKLNIEPQSVGASIDVVAINTPVQNQYYAMSGIATFGATHSGILRFRAFHQYATATDATNAVLKVKYVLTVDLTAVFGSGNEPTAAEMDAMLAFYPNSWFDGTVNLASNPKMLPYLLNQTRNRPIMASGTYAARPTSVTFPTLYLSTDKTAGSADRLTLNVGGSTWLQI